MSVVCVCLSFCLSLRWSLTITARGRGVRLFVCVLWAVFVQFTLVLRLQINVDWSVDFIDWQLNINRYIFVGGTDGEVYFGNFVSFRGCLRDVTFNGVDLISRAKSQQHDAGTAYSVDWYCSSSEFSAASDRPIRYAPPPCCRSCWWWLATNY